MTATAAPQVKPSKQVESLPPKRRWRVVRGQFTMDDPAFDHFNFKAPAGHPTSPFMLWLDENGQPRIGTNGRLMPPIPRTPPGSDDSPFLPEGGDGGLVRKSKTYTSRAYAEKYAEKYKLAPPTREYSDDIFETRLDMSILDPRGEKVEIVHDPHEGETRSDRMARLRAELAALETDGDGELPAVFEGDTLDHMTVDELRKLAADRKINVGKIQRNDKNEQRDLAKVIRAASQEMSKA